MEAVDNRCDITRRAFLRRSAVGVLGFLGGALACGRAQARASKPNIVFILADDMGWADVGYHGSVIQTPHIDRLARDGVRFGQHYVMPTCTPTRVGLMTGHYPSRYGVVSPAYGEIFDDDTVTLPAALREAGYSTHISGKWHMGSPPQWTPRKYGFDSSYGYFHGQIDPYTHHYKTGVRSWHRNDEYLDEAGHATDLITDEAVRVIESGHDKPFFLYVAYSVPHYPLDEPDRWTAIYEGEIADPSRRWLAASITHMDHGIGQLVAALDRKHLRENTLLVFVSDNGGQKNWRSDTQYKGRYADKPHSVLGDNRPLRGWKGDVYEGGIRVPALANWPGTLAPGRCKAPIHIVDWMPTLCALTGAAPARDLNWDGADVWSCVRGTAESERALYWKAPRFSAVRSGDWKLVIENDGSGAELYNLAADPYETKDLASQQSKRLAKLKRLWTDFAAGDR
jgi:arylsulfatase B